MSTKVSEEEFIALESRARARKLTLSEWVRAELLEPRNGESGAGTEVHREVLVLRTILMKSPLLHLKWKASDAGGNAELM